MGFITGILREEVVGVRSVGSVVIVNAGDPVLYAGVSGETTVDAVGLCIAVVSAT